MLKILIALLFSTTACTLIINKSNEIEPPSHYWSCQCFKNETSGSAESMVELVDVEGGTKEAQRKALNSCQQTYPNLKVAQCHKYVGGPSH